MLCLEPSRQSEPHPCGTQRALRTPTYAPIDRLRAGCRLLYFTPPRPSLPRDVAVVAAEEAGLARGVETRPSPAPGRTARCAANQLHGRVIGPRVGRRAHGDREWCRGARHEDVASVRSPVRIFVLRRLLWATSCPPSLPILPGPWSGSRQRHEVLRQPSLPPRTTRGAPVLQIHPIKRVLRAHTAGAREWVAHRNSPAASPPRGWETGLSQAVRLANTRRPSQCVGIGGDGSLPRGAAPRSRHRCGERRLLAVGSEATVRGFFDWRAACGSATVPRDPASETRGKLRCSEAPTAGHNPLKPGHVSAASVLPGTERPTFWGGGGGEVDDGTSPASRRLLRVTARLCAGPLPQAAGASRSGRKGNARPWASHDGRDRVSP